MPRQHAGSYWSGRVPWGPAVVTIMAVILLAVFPAPLFPLAYAFQALCAQFPVVAVLTRHLPPVPISLLISLAALALARGGVAGSGQLIRTFRFNRRIANCARPLPARLARGESSLDLGGRIVCLGDPSLAAFCYGFVRPRVAITTGLLERLDDEELAAVLAHERHHLRRRDPIRALMIHAFSAAAFMFPVAPAVRLRLDARLELAADRAALTVASPGALAGALLTVLVGGEAAVVGATRLSATESRIAHLSGTPALPAIPVEATAASFGVLLVVGVATAALALPPDLIAMVCRS